MKINIEKNGEEYRADCEDLPGMPPVGVGISPELAMAHLFWLILFDDSDGDDPQGWSEFVKRDEPIIVNGVKWSR